MLRVKTLTIILVILICFTSLAKAEERKKIEYYPVDDVKFLWGEEYYTELHKALQKTKESIYVVMFNLKASGRKNHPVDILLQDLIDAHRRGVQIEVILEDTLRANNQMAYNLLSQNGIKVQFDSRKTFTHTKLVVIDNYLTFVGSGNWTYASFRINTDSTVMIKSEKIAQSFMPHIEAILETLAPPKEPDTKIFLQMADNYYTNKMYDRALEEYQKVIAKFPNSPEAEKARAKIREIKAQ